MNESIISVRYTKAIFNLAVEKNCLDAVKADMEQVFGVMAESPALQNLFQNPILKPSKKTELVKQIFTGFHSISLAFIELLIKNRREMYLQNISRDFIEKYRKYKGIEPAVFVSAIKIEPSLLEKVRTLVQNLLNKEIELSNQTDENLIGGFILRIGDKQFDASVKTKLEKMKRKLVSTTIQY